MSKVLVGLTGSIACFKVAGLISDLVKSGHEVRTIASESALRFIGKPTLEGLSGNPVLTELFADGDNMEHIHIGRWADILLIAPCTANTMAKIKIGLADDLLTTTALAFEKDKPVYIAPAMNKEMWSNKATLESYKVLTERGYNFIDPEDGDLACGEVGSGRMAEPNTIFSKIIKSNSKKVLITGGGTREPIDGVRFIGNSSTGKTSQVLADSLRSKGFHVDLLMAQKSFNDYSSLKSSLESQLKNNKYDAVIHAAAVSDYSVEKIKSESYDGPPATNLKIPTGQHLTVELKSNPKLLNHLKNWSINPDIKVFGFKLTQTNNESERIDAIHKLFTESSADFIVHNDLNEIDSNSHIFRIIQGDRKLAEIDGALALSNEMAALIEGGAK